MGTDYCVSVGSRDRTARYWKVVDETQLVFRGGGTASKESPYREGSIDVVVAIPPHHFVTGGDAGTLSLWSIHKKKPLHSIAVAHGLDDAVNTSSEAEPKFAQRSPRWITALATLSGTDVVVSGSWDGFVRAWKVSDDKRRLEPLGAVGGAGSVDEPATTNGVVNGTAHDMMEVVDTDAEPKHLIRGIINDLAVFERKSPSDTTAVSKSSKKGKGQGSVKDGDTDGVVEPKKPKSLGITIVAAVGKEHRLGRWMKYQGSGVKNGAVIIDVDFNRADGQPEDGDGEAADGEGA